MKKKIKMELLNSEEARSIRGGTNSCDVIDFKGCSDKNFQIGGSNCRNPFQFNVNPCTNIEAGCSVDNVFHGCVSPNESVMPEYPGAALSLEDNK